MSSLPVPEPGREAAEAYVAEHLHSVVAESPGDITGSDRFRGGQAAADAALAAYDVTGYAARRNQVLPIERRGASGLSPWIRHGLLPLRSVWDHVADGPSRDRRKFREELLWQEFARHWYAGYGTSTSRGLRHRLPVTDDTDSWTTDDRRLRCLDATLTELESDGWLVNQTRMWLAGHWTVREGRWWPAGEEHFFRHLLDGSRAANRLGWQWTTGAGSRKPYGFSRWQVRKRAPELCATCPLADDCPIEGWPDDPEWSTIRPAPEPTADLFGPVEVESGGESPEVVWLTAESLGDEDPALTANPELPVVFVFDRPLLARLRLSAKRLVFLAETLAELAQSRDLEIRFGDPTAELADLRSAVTHAPVPGFASRSTALQPVEIHPWPWLAQPSGGSLRSFSAWRRTVTEPR